MPPWKFVLLPGGNKTFFRNDAVRFWDSELRVSNFGFDFFRPWPVAVTKTVGVAAKSFANLSLSFFCLFLDASEQQVTDGFVPILPLAVGKTSTKYISTELNSIFLVR